MIKAKKSEKLSKLIERLQEEYRTDGTIKTIKGPISQPDNLLLELISLNDDMIGNVSVKDSISQEVIGIIQNGTATGCHTLFVGPPGTGKTNLAERWANILVYLECIDNKPIEDFSIFDIIRPEYAPAAIIASIAVYEFISNKISNNINNFKRIGSGFEKISYKVIVAVSLSIFLIFYLLYLYAQWKKEDSVTKKKERKKNIKILDKSNFVGQYIGQTEHITKGVIKSCIGGAMFIDEAYLLAPNSYGGGGDFGIIALGLIIKAMSEYPDRLAVMFAGYEDEIKRTLYAAQPGLASRIKYTFKMQNYTEEELWLIFMKKFENTDYSFDPAKEKDLYKLFKKKCKLFEDGQGRSVGKLGDFLINSYSVRMTEYYLEKRKSVNVKNKEKIFAYEDLENAFKEYEKNMTMEKKGQHRVNLNSPEEYIKRFLPGHFKGMYDQDTAQNDEDVGEVDI